MESFDVIIAGAGMGGLSAAALLAKDGYSVLVLEKSHVAGGCSSSYYRKGSIFESGATTLIGFDEHQPLRTLEQKLGITIPKEPIVPSMTVHQGDNHITRWQNRDEWIAEVIRHFGEPQQQKLFWKLALDVSDVVWKVSGQNHFFPPVEWKDWFSLLKNNPLDAKILPYALQSVKETAIKSGISNPDFFIFLDEQLIISAQSASHDTPFIFGAPAITYTNYTNYYVPGGLIKMVETIEESIRVNGGLVKTKEGVESIEQIGNGYQVSTSKGNLYRSTAVISNLPVWNMEEVTTGKIAEYFRKEAGQYTHAWGAFTMGLVTDDVYPEDMTLHHQIHFDAGTKIPGIESGSLFVSFSRRGDLERTEEGQRVLNLSTHAYPEYWFGLNGRYDLAKSKAETQIVDLLRRKLPGFSSAEIKLLFSSTPVSWSKWVYRKKGRVGGIPQSMARSLLDWTPNQTPFSGLYLCGDTVYPGQGIPGVTLSGINVYLRVQKHLRNFIYH